MKPARLAVLGLSLAVGGTAYYLSGTTEAPAPVIVEAPKVETHEVLVAARNVGVGVAVGDADLRWQEWPPASTSSSMIQRSGASAVPADVKGAIARFDFLEGEPIRRDKLIKGDGSGFLAAVLPSGKRALAINIDRSGSSAAGGFVLPNDRVDLVRVFRDEESSKGAGSDVYVSETVLQNIKVLAIGQSVQEENGKKVVNGENATLELDPAQVETVILAQRLGQITLALRSLADAARPEAAKEKDASLTIMRFGVPAPGPKR